MSIIRNIDPLFKRQFKIVYHPTNNNININNINLNKKKMINNINDNNNNVNNYVENNYQRKKTIWNSKIKKKIIKSLNDDHYHQFDQTLHPSQESYLNSLLYQSIPQLFTTLRK